MTVPAALPLLDMASDPRLILGWRDGKTLVGRRVALDKDVLPSFHSIAEDTLAVLADAEARSYEPDAALEKGEQYFAVPTVDLPTKVIEEATGDGTSNAASLLAMTKAPDELLPVSPAALSDRASYLFYGLVFDTTDGDQAVFIKKTNPAQVARSSRVSLFSGRDVLKISSPPTLVLAHDIDLLVTATHVFVLSKSPFDQLLNDVAVALADVPINVARTVEALKAAVPMNDRATESLKVLAARKPSVAVRLRRLPERIANIQVTPDAIRARLVEMGNSADDLLDGDDFSFPQTRVSLFMELLEGRHFEDGWTGTRMKADKMSTHQP